MRKPLKIALLIDGLGSGGANRQLVELAVGLHEQGHITELAYYSPQRFFLPRLEEAGVRTVELQPQGTLGKLLRVRRWLRHFDPDIVQPFLRQPDSIVELLGLEPHRFRIVAAERSTYGIADARKAGPVVAIQQQLHRIADWVVLNSHFNLERLHRISPFLRHKSSVIWNMVDLDLFHPAHERDRGRPFRFLYVAAFRPEKNGPRLAEAVARLKRRGRTDFLVQWAGRVDTSAWRGEEVYEETVRKVKEYGIGDQFVFLGERRDIPELMRSSDALVHISLFEGLPNSVCEGMASGLPVVGSTTSDIPRMVRDGENGFLCDPESVDGIEEAILRCLDLSGPELRRFSEASRERAQRMFSKERFVGEFIELYRHLLS